MTSRSGVLIVKPGGGLGNRVRVVTSFALLARYTGRAFRVCWAPGKGFSDETFEELFDDVFDHVDVAEFERSMRSDNLCLDRRLDEHGKWRLKPSSSIEVLSDAHAHPTVTYQGTDKLDLAFSPPLPDLPTTFDTEYRAALRSWRPAESIRPHVDAITQRFGSSTVGVHVRRGDALLTPSTQRSARRSTDSAFFRRMDGLLAADSNVRFFLATHCEHTEARFVDRYGDRIQTNQAKRFVPSPVGEAKENQRDAVIDLFALARTQLILGSSISSFSQLAAAIGDVPLRRAVEDTLLFQVRNKLEFEMKRLRRRMRSRT